MRTIFIPIFQGVEAKNILRTDIFRILKKQKDLQIVLFVASEAKKQYFKREFAGDNIFYEVFDKYKNLPLNRLFAFLKLVLLKTKTMDLRRKDELMEQKNYLRYYLQWILNRLFAYKFWRRIVRWLDWKLVKDENFRNLFDKYKPDIVFLANLFSDLETSILREAKKRGVKSIGLINSWDKLTSRCMIRLLPDKMIVHNNIMKKEAVRYADMPEQDIEIVGIPHYDVFVNSRPSSKEEFCKIMSLDPKKKFLTFCPLGKRYGDIDVEIFDILLDFKDKKLIPDNVEILVRFPPNDIVDFEKFRKAKDVAFYQPGVRFSAGKERRIDWDMNEKDAQILFDTLFHASLIICQASSLAIDASVFNKPIINFQIKSETGVLAPRDGNWLYGLTHYQPILKSRGVRKIRNKNELLEWINKYLNNPELDNEGRARIVREQCWKMDGKAGARAAEFIRQVDK